MSIEYEFLKEKNCKGVIHIGASRGEEAEIYAELGLDVLWIEAQEQIFGELVPICEKYQGKQRALNYLITGKDQEEITFRVTNNSYSSSIFELKEHKDIWPDISETEQIPMLGFTLPTVLQRHSIDISLYDTLIMDIQGAELKALEGMKSILNNLRYIRVEASDLELYEGSCRATEIEAFLRRLHWKRIKTWTTVESNRCYEILYENQYNKKNLHIIDPMTGNENKVKVGVVTSVPRLGFQVHQTLCHNAFGASGFPISKVTGAFWEQSIQNGMNLLIDMGCEWIITLDYDTIFSPSDVQELLLMACRYPEADALSGWQVKRYGSVESLIGIRQEDGTFAAILNPEQFDEEITKIDTSVFGLTLIKVDALKRMPKPWFWSEPNSDGEWEHGKSDADGNFWRKWKEVGNTLYSANTVRIGHLEEVVLWMDRDFQPVRQSLKDYHMYGRPF